MNFLLVGANFYNKGAQLMLLSTIDSLKKRYPNDTICVSPTIGHESELKSLGVKILDYPLFHVGSGKKFRRYLKYGNWLQFFFNGPKGTIKLSEIDVILDISGFAFTDQWGVEPVKNLNLLLDEAKKHKTKYIFMPQAFGPFEKEGMKIYMTEVLSKATLVFARDPISYQYLISLQEDRDKIKLAPDITLTYGRKSHDLANYCCIIPNGRILDQGAAEWGDEYEKLLKNMINQICSQTDLEIYIVIHDRSSTDSKLAQKILESYNSNNRIFRFDEENPLKLKEFLAKSQFVIGSRFHALASSLSSNVPCIGLGWSHKYKMLFEDYEVADYSFVAPETKIMECLDDLILPGKREEIRTTLKRVNEKLQVKSEEMWELIERIL